MLLILAALLTAATIAPIPDAISVDGTDGFSYHWTGYITLPAGAEAYIEIGPEGGSVRQADYISGSGYYVFRQLDEPEGEWQIIVTSANQVRSEYDIEYDEDWQYVHPYVWVHTKNLNFCIWHI